MLAHTTILIVEDDSDDRELLLDALQSANHSVKVRLAESGVEAMDYLNQQLSAKAPLPCLIVLDLNMPYMNGKDTFNKIKGDSNLKDIPIVIFTSSLNPNDKEYYKSYGVELISKPFEYSEMDDIIHRMLNACKKI